MGLQPLEIVFLLQRGDRHYASESDVYRRQILTHNDGPRAERVKVVTKCYVYWPWQDMIDDYYVLLPIFR